MVLLDHGWLDLLWPGMLRPCKEGIQNCIKCYVILGDNLILQQAHEGRIGHWKMQYADNHALKSLQQGRILYQLFQDMTGAAT